MAPKTKQLLSDLTRRGRYGVDTGDLGFTGTPGTVFIPRGPVRPCPVIGFAHDWRVPPAAYVNTFKHLASWGFIVVAPSKSAGLFANHAKFAKEVSDAIDVVTTTTLGNGVVSADRRRIGLAGHGMGAGVVTNLASIRTDIAGVAALFPTPVQPDSSERASLIDATGLILSADGGENVAEATSVASSWNGDMIYRRVENATEAGLRETGTILSKLGMPGPHRKTQNAVRPLLAGFMLAAVGGDKENQGLLDPELKIKGTRSISRDMLIAELAVAAEDSGDGGGSPLAGMSALTAISTARTLIGK